MFLIVMAGFAGAFIVPAAYKIFGKHAGKILALLPAGIFAYLLGYIGPVSDGGIISQTVSWFPSLGIDLTFRADGLGLLFALIISGIGAAVFLFASEYMESYRFKDRFYIYINLFMASMLGVVLTDNMIAMFVFWELTSITSFLLIGFNHHKEESRYSAWQALLVTGLGGISLLAGLIILSIITGTVNLSELAAQSGVIQNSDLFIPAMILVLVGAFTKSAQFPFYFWLPNAMAAPTPVSAYLHSATMVKAGIYLMARLNPALGGNDYWNYTLAIAGGITMVIGAWSAIINTDLKRILAYTTVSVLGTLTMLIGFNSETAIKAMVIYLLAHSLYKGALFLVAGTIDHETGTRYIDKLSGLRKYLPVTFYSGALAALSMAGLAPFIGFIGKETVYEAAKKFAMGEFWLGLVVATGILTVIGGGMAGLRPFLGKSKYPGDKPHEAGWPMFFGPAVIATTGLVIGIIPGMTVNGLLSAAASSTSGIETIFTMKLWHGFNLVLVLSLITLIAGFVLLAYWDKYYPRIRNFRFPQALQPAKFYDYALEALFALGKISTKNLQNGYMGNYILFIMITFIALGYTALVNFTDFSLINTINGIDYYELALALVMASAAVMAVKSTGRLTAIASMGIVGFGVAMIFMMYGAPDLAMTQFSIETLTVILFVLVIYKLPKFVEYSGMKTRIRDFIMAASVGLFMTFIMLVTTYGGLSDEFKNYFSENSYTVAKGKNIVNVILVDFRAIDTLGEITVLAIAAIGVFALLKLRPEENK